MTEQPVPPTYDLDAMQFRIERAVEALTDPAKLEGAFIWSATPQGEEFWRASAGTTVGQSTLRLMIEMAMQLAHLNATRRAA